MLTPLVLWALTAGVIVFFWYAHFVEPRRLTLTRLRISVPRLPEALEGLRLAQLTDLHVGDAPDGFAARMARRAVELAVGCEPDLFCLTGDLSQASRAVYIAADILRPLTSRPIYVVMGNHDHDKMLETELGLSRASRLSAAEWQEALTAVGARVLQNEHEVLDIRDRRVIIAGSGDPSCGWDDLPRALDGNPQGDFHLLLVHSPDMMDDPLTDWADLVLCGHTHGGQLRLPGLGSPWAPVWRDRRRAAGLFRFGKALCYVSRGVAAGFRSRFLCPPEVVEITLTRGPGDSAQDMPRHFAAPRLA